MNTRIGRIEAPVHSPARERVASVLAACDVQLDGNRPFDIRINDPEAVKRMARQGSLGFGESYMDGQWDCDRLDMLVERLQHGAARRRATHSAPYRRLMRLSHLINLQSKARSWVVGERHYDVGNDLYERMLDSYMNYSCGYWEHAQSLEQAQQHKMELICRKLGLEPGMKVLDIGCGWGGMARYAAENYGVEVTGITISRAQRDWARSRLAGLSVEVRLQDYRDLAGQFDRIWSVGMFEHVGPRNYGAYFRKCHAVLREGGLMLLQTIGANDSSIAMDPWLHKYIFPNGVLPTVPQVAKATDRLFSLEDLHSFGRYYDQTLMAWHRRITAAWGHLRSRYDERFRRMWNFYLLACAGAFRAQHIRLWQLVLAKGGTGTQYRRPDLTDLADSAATG